MAVSHGDVIKAILADALGMHLDSFQRILVDPASISIVRYTATRPYVMTVNSTNADLAAALRRRRPRSRRRRSRRPPTTPRSVAVSGSADATTPRRLIVERSLSRLA